MPRVLDFFDGFTSSSEPSLSEFSVTTITNADSPYSPSYGSGDVILVDASLGSVTINMPSLLNSANADKKLTIKKIDSSANTVTLQGAFGTEDIDGSNTFIITDQWEAVTTIGEDSTDSYFII